MTILYHNDVTTTCKPIDTPTTSIVSSPIINSGQPTPKLPLAIRREIRDNWESKQSGLEVKLSSILDCKWTVSIDTSYLYSLAEGRYAKEDPGAMLAEYISEAISSIQSVTETYGDDGKTELNNLASAHVITLQPTSDPEIEYNDCEISEGCLRLLFSKGNLGVNVYRAAENLPVAINDAGKASGAARIREISFLAAHSIKKAYQLNINAIQFRIAVSVALTELTMSPNFASNYAKLAGYEPDNHDFPKDWERTFGKTTLEYFEGLASYLEEEGFGNDDLLAEGFREAVYRGEVMVRIVNELTKGEFYECVIEDGILYLQTEPRYWTSGSNYVAKGLMEIL